jgi:hypothetical protein
MAIEAVLLNVPDHRVRCHVGNRSSVGDSPSEIRRGDVQLGNDQLPDSFAGMRNGGVESTKLEGRIPRPIDRDDLTEIGQKVRRAPGWEIA